MSISLPLDNSTYPLMRILVRQNWGGTTQSGGGWEPLKMQRRGIRQHGYVVEDFDRVCLPAIGEARFHIDVGDFDDTTVAMSSGSAQRARSGQAWDPTTDSLDVRDLTGYWVRIQAAEAPGENETPTYRTVWVGTVFEQRDQGWPGASLPAGRRTYYCFDFTSTLGTWQIDRHCFEATDPNTGVRRFTDVKGHPGYNVESLASGGTLGNKSLSAATVRGATIHFHTPPGVGVRWSDLAAVEHALAITRPEGQPLLQFAGSTALLSSGSSVWPIQYRENVRDFVSRVCARERGRGMVYLDWSEADADAPLNLFLTVRPQLLEDFTFTDPATGSSTTLPGATTAGTTTTVDLIEDHRAVASAFLISDPRQHQLDYIVSEGEPIEVLATIAYVDGLTSGNGRALQRGWTPEDQTAFRALTAAQRVEERWRPVYQCHRLAIAWDGYAGDGNGGPLGRVDFRCTDSGSLIVPRATPGYETLASDTSPALIEVLSDLPLFEGYAYSSSTPVRADGTTETATPRRRPVFPMLRLSSGKFISLEEATETFSLRLDDNVFTIEWRDDHKNGTRYLSDTTLSSLSAGYAHSQLVVTVGLRLPHRVRFATGDPNGRRVGITYHPGHHLWLASSGAIYDLDSTSGTATTGHNAKRGACGATATSPGILRDDRLALSALHRLAVMWYMSTRNTARWELRACGLLPSFTQRDGTVTPYPTLGQLVTTLAANGEVHTLNTPVTRITYRHDSATTTWESGWCSLDWAS